ncbi:MAG: hypothetical protein R2728_10720 [Chitinophagales bacterium]
MGIAKVVGVIFILGSTIWGTLMGFVYISKSFDNATGGRISLSEAGVLVPLIICLLFFVMGNVLVRDRVLESHH